MSAKWSANVHLQRTTECKADVVQHQTYKWTKGHTLVREQQKKTAISQTFIRLNYSGWWAEWSDDTKNDCMVRKLPSPDNVNKIALLNLQEKIEECGLWGFHPKTARAEPWAAALIFCILSQVEMQPLLENEETKACRQHGLLLQSNFPVVSLTKTSVRNRRRKCICALLKWLITGREVVGEEWQGCPKFWHFSQAGGLSFAERPPSINAPASCWSSSQWRRYVYSFSSRNPAGSCLSCRGGACLPQLREATERPCASFHARPDEAGCSLLPRWSHRRQSASTTPLGVQTPHHCMRPCASTSSQPPGISSTCNPLSASPGQWFLRAPNDATAPAGCWSLALCRFPRQPGVDPVVAAPG